MLAGYEKLIDGYRELDVSIVAGTVDSEEKCAEVEDELSFPVACGMSRADADALGAWWEERRDHIQPAEFILNRKGRVLASTYSSSPVGRMDPAETLKLLQILSESRKKS